MSAGETAVDVSLRQARAHLLTGRGPGASPVEVAAHTRNRVAIAGVSSTRRRELQARQTSRARGDVHGLTDVVQLDRGELDVELDRLAGRSAPARMLGVAGRWTVDVCLRHPQLVGGALLLAVAVRHRRRR